MDLLTIVLVLIAIGMILWAVNTYIPLDGKIKKILNTAVVIITIIWLLKVCGVWQHLSNIHI